MIDAVQVGLKISALRKKNKMSQEELAEKLFVTRQALSKWELGQGLPSIDTIIELAKIFSTDFEDLLCLGEDNLKINKDNIFSGHSRSYIINKLINNELDVKLEEVFDKLSNYERILILKSIKNHKTRANINELLHHLTNDEKTYLGGYVYEIKKNHN